MNNSFQSSGLSFDVLRLKYKVINLPERISSVLMGILKRRDRGTKLSFNEINTLKNYDFSELKIQEDPSSNTLYQILNKVESGGELSQVDFQWLTAEKMFDTIEFIATEFQQKQRKQNQLDILKTEYKIVTPLAPNCDSILLAILTNIDNMKTLSEFEINWLKNQNLMQTLEIYQNQELQKKYYQQQREEKKQATEFSRLKSKYKATKHDGSLSTPLYPILLKLDKCERLIGSEIEWLKNNQLFDTLEIYQKQESETIARLQKEAARIKADRHFSELKIKYKFSCWDSSVSNRLYLILCTIDRGELPINSDVEWVKSLGFSKLTACIDKMQHFTELKEKYKAVQYQDASPSSYLYRILKQLETGERLNTQDGEWLKKHKLLETFAIFQERESLQRDELSQLKDKYKASKCQSLSTSNKLYEILHKLESNNQLSQREIDWLQKQRLTDTIAIASEIEQKKHFAALKFKYQATQYKDSSPSNLLYQILKKIDSGQQPSDAEINWLSNHGLHQVIAIAKHRELQQHFTSLKAKYHVSDFREKSHNSNLYLILQKLERQERLEATDVAWLTENQLFYPNEKIAIEYHRIEAIFYGCEFQRTKNQWNLPSASSHWRKAGEFQTALKLTDDLDWERIKDRKLKSALLTTRGGAFRDIQHLNKAEKCAKEAIDCQPCSHHPYTLMGAICYERCQYLEGDNWFNEAIKRGANPRDMDSEIKRVVRDAKNENQRREVVEYLLKKDPSRYAWAKAYLKKRQNKSL